MNGLERLQAALRFESADRLPVVPQIFGHAAVLAGVPLGDYVRSGELVARCQSDALRHYGHDAVFAFLDACVETEAMGAVLAYHADQYPSVAGYPLDAGAAPERLAIPDPQSAGRMPQVLAALAGLRAAHGQTAAVVGVVLGPMTLAQQLMGPEAALYLAADEPQSFEKLLDRATEVALRFGRAQLEAGAHLMMVFDPAASPDVVPAAFFREFELPRLSALFGAFKQAGSLANWLHIAGQIAPILGYYPEAAVDIANFDYCVDPLQARQILPHLCLDGNIKSLSFVLNSPEEIAAEAHRLVELFAGRGGFILSSGCEVPPEAKPQNVAAMVAAACTST